MRTRAGVAVTLLLALALAATALGSGASAADASGLRWKRCAERSGWQCATAVVPKDYANPGAGSLRLAVTRHRARRSKGSVFMNFGGPGAPAVPAAQQSARSLLGPVFDRFDVVAFDPRGVGASRPAIDCRVDQESAGIYAQPFGRPHGLDAAALVARSRAYVERCVQRNGAVLPHVGTADNARDMDRLRRAVGDERLTFVGFSYGTALGATYAALFPDRIRALVLDGAVNLDRWFNAPLEDVFAQTAGFEDALDRYLAACDRRPRACGFAGRDGAGAALDRLLARVDAQPLRVGRRTVDGDDVRMVVSQLLYARSAWPVLSLALDRVAGGDGELVRLIADELYGRREDGRHDPFLDQFFAISALDQVHPTAVEPFLAMGARAFAAFPRFGINSGFADLPWGLHPIESPAVFRGPWRLPAAATATPLVIGATHDPATPYAGAKAMTAQLGKARLLTMRGDGHTALGSGSTCVDRLVRRYLLDTTLPAAGRICRQRVTDDPFAAASAAGLAGAVRRLRPWAGLPPR